MRILTRAAIAISAAALAVTGAAGAASASTVHHHPGPPPGHSRGGPQVFTISADAANPGGVVNAYGVIQGRDGTQANSSSSTVAVFGFARGTVTVDHTATPDPQVSWRSCTAVLHQHGDFTIAGGTGAYRGAQGHGRFRLDEYARFQRVHGRCPAGNPDANPSSFRLTVVAVGTASLPHHYR